MIHIPDPLRRYFSRHFPGYFSGLFSDLTARERRGAPLSLAFRLPQRLRPARLFAVLAAAWFAGSGLAAAAQAVRPLLAKPEEEVANMEAANLEVSKTDLEASGTSLEASGTNPGTSGTGLEVSGTGDGILLPSDGNWGLSFPQEGKTPIGNATAEELSAYNAWYAGSADEPVIYLTFDAGYENGNTPAILDALKKHSAPAAFFVVGNYLETSPELVKRMRAEGHTVANHTWHHPDMSKISTAGAFQKELSAVEEKFTEITGETMPKYYRPPQGKYSEANLQMAKELGYQTFFWSLAYVDWQQDSQPSKEEAFQKLLGRIHPGAIVLLHSTSSTNAAILDELLTKWEEMGYRFGSLDELVSAR